MPYKIVCWILAEPEEPEIYETEEEAFRALAHYQLIQPENLYRMEKVDPFENGVSSKKDHLG